MDGAEVPTFEEILNADQIRVRELEAKINKDLDEKIAQNPERMPGAIWFIIPNEFAERYCFYGITPILKNFFKFMVGYTPLEANELYHTFKSVAYFTPLLGAALSDSFLNKYNTIVSLSFLYTIGVILLSIFAVPGILGKVPNIPRWGPLLAIFSIAVGTGGIKPCVSAHGGDQFIDIQTYGLQKFYNYFYMAINSGAVITSFVSPIIKGKNCYGLYEKGDCYSAAFALCAGVMFCATIIFIIGKRYYRVVPAAGKFMPFELAKVGAVYATKAITAGGPAKAYTATSKVYGEGLLVELFDMSKVFLVLLPAPVFWMAFDQNGSTWQDMGDQMDQTNFLNSEIVNNAINPIFICLLAPIFANFVYPYMDRVAPKSFGLLQPVIQQKIDETCEIVLVDEAPICISKSVHIGWQVLMYFIITVGEVFFSISGLNFTYVEVGKRLKSSCAAIWLLYRYRTYILSRFYVPKAERKTANI
ncbi:POT family-domain-containing protein [Chytridium lagenaria]|nr:POT family-domain-containing protein [Chytridium lagenaria]